MYTFERWGEVQADHYIDGLHAQISKAADNPVMLRKLPEDTIGGVCFFRFKRHYIFVKDLVLSSDQPLHVLSILHDTMDIPARLGELLDEL